MVTLDHVSFAYRDVPVLHNVSLSLPARGTMCLCAPSGGGKTTLLRLIAGLETPHSGTVSNHARRTTVVFQENRLFPWLTAAQNVALACPHSNPQPFLESVGLATSDNSYPAQLSGGMQRRVALARALAFGGDLLLLDEPFNGLDAELRDRCAAAIRRRFSEACIVLITHDKSDAERLGATVVSLPAPLCGTVSL